MLRNYGRFLVQLDKSISFPSAVCADLYQHSVNPFNSNVITNRVSKTVLCKFVLCLFCSNAIRFKNAIIIFVFYLNLKYLDGKLMLFM